MTDATAAASGTPNPTGASSTNTGGTPNGESLLTEGTNPGGTEAKAGEATPPQDGAKAGDQKPDDKGAAPAVPEKYEFAMPEGVELDTAAADEFSAVAKELKLSQADAQRVADIAVKMQAKQAERTAEIVKGWAESSKTDKEFGGDNLKQNLAVARKAIDTFGSNELKELLDNNGLGNHPEIIRFAFRAGKAISEDGFVKAGARAPTGAAQSLEKRLYPNMN